MKRVLAAVAPSPGDSDVLRAALDVARGADAKVSVLRVVEAAGEMPESNEALVSEARQQLQELTREVPAQRLDALLASTGVAWREICGAAESADADLVVIGARRYGPLERALGTTAARVVNHCNRSVLAVRGWRRPPERMLVALDAGPQAAAVRDYAVALARRTSGKLRLFRVFDMPSAVPADMVGRFPTIEDALHDAARKALDGHEQQVPPELRDGVSTAYGATAWREICAAARESEADLVVIGSHGYGFADRLLGTIAADVVHHADRSVLIVRRPWRD